MKSVDGFFRALFSHTCFLTSACQTPETAIFFKHELHVPEFVDYLTRVGLHLKKCLFLNAYNYYFLIVWSKEQSLNEG